jgi:hypothetical protein
MDTGVGVKEIEFGGGESVYCINEMQVKKAIELVEGDSESSPKINAHLEKISSELTKNEQTALAFVLIEKLLKT